MKQLLILLFIAISYANAAEPIPNVGERSIAERAKEAIQGMFGNESSSSSTTSAPEEGRDLKTKNKVEKEEEKAREKAASARVKAEELRDKALEQANLEMPRVLAATEPTSEPSRRTGESSTSNTTIESPKKLDETSTTSSTTKVPESGRKTGESSTTSTTTRSLTGFAEILRGLHGGNNGCHRKHQGGCNQEPSAIIYEPVRYSNSKKY